LTLSQAIPRGSSEAHFGQALCVPVGMAVAGANPEITLEVDFDPKALAIFPLERQQQLLQLWAESCKKLIEELLQALKVGQLDSLAELSHSIKGASLKLELFRLASVLLLWKVQQRNIFHFLISRQWLWPCKSF